MRYLRLLFILAVAIAGCAPYSLVGPEPVTISGVYTVQPQIAWSAFTAGKWEHWTLDGFSLQDLSFLKGLEDGEQLRVQPEEKHPRFRKTMTASEIMEFVVDTYAAADFQKVTTSNLKPEKFGTAQGFRFEMTYLMPTGLEKQAIVVGAVLNERLYLIIYSGAGQHYYAKYKDHAERTIQSVRLK